MCAHSYAYMASELYGSDGQKNDIILRPTTGYIDSLRKCDEDQDVVYK